jgi:GTP-binding protein EngB required for normal cell division
MTVVSETSVLHRMYALGATLAELDSWLKGPHAYPLADEERRRLTDAIDDLRNRVVQMEAEPTLLTVVLMGGTGVGKSTLLNALAGNAIAEAGIVRPTTNQATVYHHRDVAVDRLAPPLAQCRRVAHDRPELRQKLIVDTPDMDGNVLEHRERLKQILPVADAVLYVGSQEKYHDREGWKLLLEHRRARAFAFVMNKWDRCRAAAREKSGRAPDLDFRSSLSEAGFSSPLVFRTCARDWVKRRDAKDEATGAADDDFTKLEEWLDEGLTERAILQIKVHGVAGRLDQLVEVLQKVVPPDWSTQHAALKESWTLALRDAVGEHAELLAAGADRHAATLERHFAQMGRENLRGLFRWYLMVLDRLTHLRLTLLPKRETAASTPVDALAARCAAEIPGEVAESRRQSLLAHLLAEADRAGWPLEPLKAHLPADHSHFLGSAGLARIQAEQLVVLEHELKEPSGSAMAARVIVTGLCDWGPYVALGILGFKFLYDLFLGWRFWGITEMLQAIVFLMVVFFGLHLLWDRTAPVRWDVLRRRLVALISDRLFQRLAPVYLDALDKLSAQLLAERNAVQRPLELLEDLREQLGRASKTSEQRALFAQVTE